MTPDERPDAYTFPFPLRGNPGGPSGPNDGER